MNRKIYNIFLMSYFMVEYNEVQIWSAIHGNDHPDLTEDEGAISGYMPLIEELFPGINYYSISGFGQVMKDYVQPALSKQFPDLAKKSTQEVSRDRTVSVEELLPSKGYEHSDNPQWKQKLDELLQ